MKQPHNETAALIRAAADATGCRTVSALAQRLGVPLRTVQQWSHQDSLSEPTRMLLVLLAARMVTPATIDELTAGWKRYWEDPVPLPKSKTGV